MGNKKRHPIERIFFLDIFLDRRTRPFMIYIGVILLIGVVLFHWLEGWSWIDSFYFVVITVSTIGYGDFSPTTPLTKLITIFYGINGLIVLLMLFDVVRAKRQWQIGSGSDQEGELD